jgi:hypothetical protein
MKTKIYWIAKTAVFIALLIALQAVTKPAGQFVTGSVVNLILISSTVLGGVLSGASVAIISPFIAYFFGIGPVLFPVVPFIAVGNLVLVLVWWLICRIKMKPVLLNYIIATVVASPVKFILLYLLISNVAVRFIENQKQANIIAMFSYPQLITAAIGGAVACIILPLLAKTIADMEKRAGVRKTA